MPPLRSRRTRSTRSATNPPNAELAQRRRQQQRMTTISQNSVIAASGMILLVRKLNIGPVMTFQSSPMLDTIAVAEKTALLPQYVSLTAIETPEMMIDIRNQAAIAEVLTMANHMLETNRAKNTRKAYDPKKRLWFDWCKAEKFADGTTVHEGKLLLWLNKVVFAHGNQGRGQEGSMLTHEGVEGYIKPIIDLYQV